MCCIAVLMAAIGPRVAFVFAWLFTARVDHAFHGNFFEPLLGMLFLPWTALLWVIVYAPGVGVTGFGWFLVLIGFAFDLASYSSGAYKRRGSSTR